MTLTQQDFDAFGHLMDERNDNIVVSIARSFERLEEHLGDTESRLYNRIAEAEDAIDALRSGTKFEAF